jgi:hypothetical protein
MEGSAFVLAVPVAAEAQPTTTIPRIGLLGDAASWESLRQGLRDLGYVEGKTFCLRSEALGVRASDIPIWRPSLLAST